ncbi:MAG: alpha/beta hydrolase [Pseudomonadota bacterium]
MSVVYQGMTQAELDAQYDQRTLVPDAADHMALWQGLSEATVSMRTPRTLSYGDGPAETMLIFEGAAKGAAHFHVHGGAWRQLSAHQSAFVADGLGADGAHVAVVEFSLAPHVPLGVMVDQVRRAFVAFAHHSSGKVFVSAHSSGCHLSAMLLDGRWQDRAGMTGVFAGLVLASGVYDLEPVRLSARNNYLRLTEADAADLSPHNHLVETVPPADLLWGDGELAEFKRQSADFAGALRARGGTVSAVELPGLNHFDMYGSFRDPSSAVCQAARAQMRLG